MSIATLISVVCVGFAAFMLLAVKWTRRVGEDHGMRWTIMVGLVFWLVPKSIALEAVIGRWPEWFVAGANWKDYLKPTGFELVAIAIVLGLAIAFQGKREMG